MLEQLHQSVLEFFRGEIEPGGLLYGDECQEGIKTVLYADEDKMVSSLFPFMSLSWVGLPILEWTVGKSRDGSHRSQLDSFNAIDISIYVQGNCMEESDRKLQRLVWDKSSTPHKGLIPALAKLTGNGVTIPSGGDRWLVVPGRRLQAATIKGKQFCSGVTIQARFRNCQKIEMEK